MLGSMTSGGDFLACTLDGNLVHGRPQWGHLLPWMWNFFGRTVYS